ncbi:hypothetical protein AK812_SmicGene48062, partial [Symbiodinium microadriaticum]
MRWQFTRYDELEYTNKQKENKQGNEEERKQKAMLLFDLPSHGACFEEK